ncbi:MAG: hypothetical protein LBJ73_00650 [Rickettsiales bacterium]|jgi:hypothetical protein|nr:hypothetical protein [Rickettsiales bacterium]
MKIVQKITDKLFTAGGRIILPPRRTDPNKPTDTQAMYEDQYGRDITAALDSHHNLDAAGAVGEAVRIYTGGYKLTDKRRDVFPFYILSPSRLNFGNQDITDRVTQNFITEKYAEVINSAAYRFRVSLGQNTREGR